MVRRFGQLQPDLQMPGLHYDLPWPLSVVDRVRRDEARQVHVGFLAAEETIFVETNQEFTE